MAFKVSNETKVGALTAITITLFILGFNFLKGKNPLKRAKYYYAKFESSEGLLPSNPVIIKGLTVGNVYATAPLDEDLSSVLVTIRFTENVKVPVNSVAQIKSNPLGTPSIEIVKGDSKNFLQPGDTLLSVSTPGFFGSVFDKLGPTQKALDKLLSSLDSVASKINQTFNSGVQADVQQTIAHLSTASSALNKTIQLVNNQLDAQSGNLAKTMQHMEAFSGTLDDNKNQIGVITGNLSKTTQKLSELDLKTTLSELSATLQSLKAVVDKLNRKDGTIGMLLNDPRAYNNLNSTINSVNLMMQDLRMHPKRYVSISVFGKKDKSEPLMRPLTEDSVTQEQRRN